MDAATGHIDVEFQTFFSSEETVQAIKNYKDKCRDNGIIIQEYQFDNGSSFTSQSLRDYLKQKRANQLILRSQKPSPEWKSRTRNKNNHGKCQNNVITYSFILARHS